MIQLLQNLNSTLPNWADILMLIITTLGTLFVAFSFNEQRKINSQQTQLNKYALEDSRRKVRPWFKIHSQETMDSDDPFQTVYHVPYIVLTNSVAMNVLAKDIEEGSKSFPQDEGTINSWLPETMREIKFDPRISMLVDVKSFPIIALKFNDEDGREYIQTVSYEVNNKTYFTNAPVWTNSSKS